MVRYASVSQAQRRKTEERKKSRGKWLIAGIAAVVAVIAATILCRLVWGSEDDDLRSLPPEERLIRSTVRAFDPEQTTLQRLQSVRRALQTIEDLPRARREGVIIEAMTAGVNGNLEAFRALPEAEKPARAERLYQDALRTRSYFRNLPAAKRKRAKDLLYSDTGAKAEVDRAMNTILNTLTPKEREMLNPVFTVWKNMLEEK